MWARGRAAVAHALFSSRTRGVATAAPHAVRGRKASSATAATMRAAPSPLPSLPSSSVVEVLSGPPLTVLRVPVLSDNYVWLLRSHTGGPDGRGVVAVVDPAEASPVAAALADAAQNIPGWPCADSDNNSKTPRLDYILNTHHHFDHVGGNLELKKQFPALKIVGPKADAARIPGLDLPVGDGVNANFSLGVDDLNLVAIDTPGHTRGHVCLWFPGAKCLFTGDTVFALGCGRLFEGDAKTMWRSLCKLRDDHNIPPETIVFCAHEYTQSNARFALEVAEPDNAALEARKQAIDAARARGDGTVPFLWREELETNPFLRADKAGVAKAAGVDENNNPVEVFRRVRAAKDSFR
jgi:hydroxyacylglutathione hydrolase